MANRLKHLFSNSIRSKLFLSFAVILLIPSLTIALFSYSSASTTVDDQLKLTATQNVSLLDATISKFIQPEIDNIGYLAEAITPPTYLGDATRLRTSLLGPFMKNHPEISALAFATPAGLYINGDNAKMPDGYDARQRPWFKDALDHKGQVLITASYVSKTTQDYVVGITKTTNDGLGVIIFEVKLATLADITKLIHIGTEGYAYILDRNQTFMVHPSSEIGAKAEGQHYDDMFKANNGLQTYQLDNKSTNMSYVTNPLTGWKIAGTWFQDESTKAASPIFNKTALILAIAVILGAFLVFLIVRSITAPLKRLTTITERIADGDLTQEVEIRSRDELGQLSVSVNHMVQKLRNLIEEVVGSSQNVGAASEQISASTQEVASGSSAQAQAAETMQELFGELSAAIDSVAQSAEEAAKLAGNTSFIAHEGGNIVKQSVTSMSQVGSQMTQLEKDSNKIGAIIEVIDDIAEQTNLLALNAAIEAARAGEMGRGFAVVADEVRKLAERSGDATKQITSIIKGMQDNTKRSVTVVTDGVNQSQETGKAFDRIVQMISDTENKVNEIAAASEEQTAQTDQVMQSIHNISSASQQAAAASQETAATSQSLAQLAERLTDSVNVFKVK